MQQPSRYYEQHLTHAVLHEDRGQDTYTVLSHMNKQIQICVSKVVTPCTVNLNGTALILGVWNGMDPLLFTAVSFPPTQNHALGPIVESLHTTGAIRLDGLTHTAMTTTTSGSTDSITASQRHIQHKQHISSPIPNFTLNFCGFGLRKVWLLRTYVFQNDMARAGAVALHYWWKHKVQGQTEPVVPQPSTQGSSTKRGKNKNKHKDKPLGEQAAADIVDAAAADASTLGIRQITFEALLTMWVNFLLREGMLNYIVPKSVQTPMIPPGEVANLYAPVKMPSSFTDPNTFSVTMQRFFSFVTNFDWNNLVLTLSTPTLQKTKAERLWTKYIMCVEDTYERNSNMLQHSTLETLTAFLFGARSAQQRFLSDPKPTVLAAHGGKGPVIDVDAALLDHPLPPVSFAVNPTHTSAATFLQQNWVGGIVLFRHEVTCSVPTPKVTEDATIVQNDDECDALMFLELYLRSHNVMMVRQQPVSEHQPNNLVVEKSSDDEAAPAFSPPPSHPDNNKKTVVVFLSTQHRFATLRVIIRKLCPNMFARSTTTTITKAANPEEVDLYQSMFSTKHPYYELNRFTIPIPVKSNQSLI
eukprot:PhF_6_TR26714/c0_g1_i5/m.39087